MSRRLIGLALVLLCVPAAAIAGHRFHAAAVALGGDDVSSVGSVSLASTGGKGVDTIRDYDDGFVRFAEATSVVSGRRVGMVAHTTSVVTIRDLDIAGRIHADLLVARVTERHAAGAAEAEITFEGSTIENLTIDGAPVPVTLDTAYFAGRPTFAAMQASGVGSRYGTTLCTLNGVASCGATRQDSWSVRVAGLGTLTIGEVFMSHGHRQINLLRLERDEPSQKPGRRWGIIANDGGTTTKKSIVVGAAEGNGTDFLP